MGLTPSWLSSPDDLLLAKLDRPTGTSELLYPETIGPKLDEIVAQLADRAARRTS